MTQIMIIHGQLSTSNFCLVLSPTPSNLCLVLSLSCHGQRAQRKSACLRAVCCQLQMNCVRIWALGRRVIIHHTDRTLCCLGVCASPELGS